MKLNNLCRTSPNKINNQVSSVVTMGGLSEENSVVNSEN